MSAKSPDNFFGNASVSQRTVYADAVRDQVAGSEKITISLRLTAEQHRQTKMRAAQQGQTMSAYVARLIENDI